MTKTEALGFVQAVRESPELRARLRQAATRADVVSLAASEGFQLDAETLDAINDELANALQAARGELVEAELNQVTGGSGALATASGPTVPLGDDNYARVKVKFPWEP